MEGDGVEPEVCPARDPREVAAVSAVWRPGLEVVAAVAAEGADGVATGRGKRLCNLMLGNQ